MYTERNEGGKDIVIRFLGYWLYANLTPSLVQWVEITEITDDRRYSIVIAVVFKRLTKNRLSSNQTRQICDYTLSAKKNL